MCNPTLITAAAAQVGGMSMQANASRKAEDARALAMRNTSNKNLAVEQQAAAAVGDSVALMDKPSFDQGVDGEASNLAKIFNANTGQNVLPTNSTVGVPSIIEDANMQEMALAAAENAKRNSQLSSLNSVSSYLGSTINPAFSDSSARGAMAGNFMQGNSNGLQSQLDAANQLAISPMAQLLTGAGQVGFGYGLKSPKVIDSPVNSAPTIQAS